ncbi:MAG: HNH endonuclease [Actinomycetota bacterium]|nr:HNH endonuclease [Actinomycetota bacterium]
MWTDEYQASLAGRDAPTAPWRHPEVVAALAEETHGKCAYCEGIISDVSYPHVEHILPKSLRPDLVVKWENLTLGCAVCNTNKGAYYDPGAPLIHPYNDDPLSHIAISGPAIMAQLGDDKGARTILRLKLMRSPLMIERMRRIQALHLLLDRWTRTKGPDKETLEDAVREELADDKEFAQSLRAYAESMGFPV